MAPKTRGPLLHRPDLGLARKHLPGEDSVHLGVCVAAGVRLTRPVPRTCDCGG